MDWLRGIFGDNGKQDALDEAWDDNTYDEGFRDGFEAGSEDAELNNASSRDEGFEDGSQPDGGGMAAGLGPCQATGEREEPNLDSAEIEYWSDQFDDIFDDTSNDAPY